MTSPTRKKMAVHPMYLNSQPSLHHVKEAPNKEEANVRVFVYQNIHTQTNKNTKTWQTGKCFIKSAMEGGKLKENYFSVTLTFPRSSRKAFSATRHTKGTVRRWDRADVICKFATVFTRGASSL